MEQLFFKLCSQMNKSDNIDQDVFPLCKVLTRCIYIPKTCLYFNTM